MTATAGEDGFAHAPVMLNEVVSALAPTNGGVYADATVGGGGYTRAILGAANCSVIGLDRDPDAIKACAGWAGAYGGRLSLTLSRFGELEAALDEAAVDLIDGAVFDLGVSSVQLDQAERGFSFRAEGPLDMRMGQDGVSAADLVNELAAEDLAEILYMYGEERNSRRIARAVVKAREAAAIETTAQLAEIIERVQPRRPGDKIHPATRAFMALRIAVNDEYGELARGLAAAEKRLAPAGRLVVVTFHSVEDRMVKQFFNARSGKAGGGSRHAPPTERAAPTFRLLFNKAQTPTPEEEEANPRARSAKLRAGVRTDALPSAGDPTPAPAPDLELSPAARTLLGG